MGAPIYIHLAVFDYETPKISSKISCLKNQLAVADPDADEDEQIKLRYLDLPDLGLYDFSHSSFAVANSRLFFVGGCLKNQSKGAQHNGIMSLNLLQQKRKRDEDDSPSPSPSLSWEAVRVRDEIFFAQGTWVSEDSNLIYAIGMGGALWAFYSETMTIKFDISNAVPVPRCHRPYLLALDDNKIYVNCVSDFDNSCSLGFFDLVSKTWHTMDTKSSLHCLLPNMVVVVRNSYMISFALFHPVTNQFDPALYVYDIWGKKWINERVHGLGHIVPLSSEAYRHKTDYIYDPSLIQIPKEQLKFALFWQTRDRDTNISQFHLTKFSLNIQEQQNGASPTFRADHFSYAPCFSDTAELLTVKITA